MKTVKHPTAYLSSEIIEEVSKYAAAAEQLQQLHPKQIELIHKQKWFNLFVQKEYNGLSLSLPKALHLEEALAYADGSVGWTVTLCAGAAWFVGVLQPTLSNTVFNEHNTCIAGSGKAGGVAHKTADGFIVNGAWDYATGAPFATAFTANCIVYENDKPLADSTGNNILLSFLFLKEEVTIKQNWNKVGMVATGSRSFTVNDLHVPVTRTFVIDSKYAQLPQPIYQYPFLALAQTTLAVNSSGMAMRFLDICNVLAETNKYVMLKRKLPKAYATLEKQRQMFYKEVAKSWSQSKANKLFPKTHKKVGRLSKKLAVQSRNIVDKLYPFCGMGAANPLTEINRVWRNMHTASQHGIFN